MSTKQDHKRWRNDFNEGCLKRDGNKCVFCKSRNDLDVHHITDRHEFPNGGYAISNGITVCKTDHCLCEEYHICGTCLPEYHPNQLYKMINSSYEQAYNDSLNLK